MEWSQILVILIPLLIIEIAFRIYALRDILKPNQSVNFLPKKYWIVIVLVINFGWVFYLLIGRTHQNMNSW
jgi:flagellar biosynthesis protein FliQ